MKSRRGGSLLKTLKTKIVDAATALAEKGGHLHVRDIHGNHIPLKNVRMQDGYFSAMDEHNQPVHVHGFNFTPFKPKNTTHNAHALRHQYRKRSTTPWTLRDLPKKIFNKTMKTMAYLKYKFKPNNRQLEYDDFDYSNGKYTIKSPGGTAYPLNQKYQFTNTKPHDSHGHTDTEVAAEALPKKQNSPITSERKMPDLEELGEKTSRKIRDLEEELGEKTLKVEQKKMIIDEIRRLLVNETSPDLNNLIVSKDGDDIIISKGDDHWKIDLQSVVKLEEDDPYKLEEDDPYIVHRKWAYLEDIVGSRADSILKFLNFNLFRAAFGQSILLRLLIPEAKWVR